MVSDAALATAQKALAGIARIYPTLTAHGLDKIHQRAELLVRKLQHRVFRRTAGRENREYAPAFHPARDEKIAKLGQRIHIAPRNACDHVVSHTRLCRYRIERPHGPFETLRIAAHPVMLRLETVQTERYGV